MENKNYSNENGINTFSVKPYTPKESLEYSNKKKEKTSIVKNLLLSAVSAAGLIGAVYLGNKVMNNELTQINQLEKSLLILGTLTSSGLGLTLGPYSASKVIQGVKDKINNFKSKSSNKKYKN